MAIDFKPLDQEEGRAKKPSGIDFQPMDDESQDDSGMVDTFLGKMPRKNKAFDPEQMRKEFEQTAPNLRKALPGAAQGYINSLIGMANLLPKVNIPKADFAPRNEMTSRGELAGDIASYFGPRAALGVTKIPHLVSNALKEFPVASTIMKNLGAGAEAALFGAAHAPEGEKGQEAGKAGLIGSGMDLALRTFGSKNPIINALLRSGVGAAGGGTYGALTGQNPLKTAGYGSAMMLGAPYLGKALGMGGKTPGLETIENLTAQEAVPGLEAAKRLKTTITPAEASGNEYVGGLEGRYGRTPQAAAEKTRIGLARYKEQKGAIDDLFNTIFDKSSPQAAKASQKKIDDLYKVAMDSKLPVGTVESFKEDPVIEAAYAKVKSDPAYRRKLKNVPEESYAYLNQVKRALDDMEGAAIKAGEKTRAAEFGDARTTLLKAMDDNEPVYAQARAEAQKSIVRSNLEKAMRKKELKGSDFFNTVIKNEHEFNKLLDSLKNVPEAQSKLRDMQLAWKNLINLSKPGNKAFREETGLNQSRNLPSKIVDMWAEITGERRNIKALNFIHSPDWDKAFNQLRAIKDEKERMNKLSQLMARLFTSGAVRSQSE